MEKKTVPYEILIRFGFGGDNQTCKPGEFSGAHYIMADLIVDDDGSIISTRIGHAQDISEELLKPFVGEQIAAINAGMNSIKKQLSDSVADNEQLNNKIQELETTNQQLATQLASALAPKTEA